MTNELNLPPELREKAKAAPSSVALLALAQENGIALTDEEATLYFAQLHPEAGVLSDEELDNVAGGGACDPDPCPDCKSTNTTTAKDSSFTDPTVTIYFKCMNCGKTGIKKDGKIILQDW